mmetsp:Transcript_10666/g.25130  ORF Transcript_10666/g.25130 Transcript_10666/m.25130 type:complete len:266 (+) Transcript_10666:389-1186(+)
MILFSLLLSATCLGSTSMTTLFFQPRATGSLPDTSIRGHQRCAVVSGLEICSHRKHTASYHAGRQRSAGTVCVGFATLLASNKTSYVTPRCSRESTSAAHQRAAEAAATFAAQTARRGLHTRRAAGNVHDRAARKPARPRLQHHSRCGGRLVQGEAGSVRADVRRGAGATLAASAGAARGRHRGGLAGVETCGRGRVLLPERRRADLQVQVRAGQAQRVGAVERGVFDARACGPSRPGRAARHRRRLGPPRPHDHSRGTPSACRG